MLLLLTGGRIYDKIYIKDGDDMQCTSVSAFKECLTPNKWNFPNITRPFSILYYALGGTAFYKIDGEEHRFVAGHLYILPANKVFSLYEDENDKFYSVYVHAHTFPEIDKVIDVDTQGDEFLLDTLTLLRKYVASKSNADKVKGLVGLIIAYVCEKQSLSDISMAQKIKAYIEKNFVSVFKNSDLSGVFNYSSSYLVKIYKNEFKITPKHYAEQLVLRESVILLFSGMTINEISARLEFSSPENFSRFFKGYYGCSPSIYREKYKHFPT